ncbi:metabotropic glutamate receptor 3-like [Glandiceps talaboti]
MEHTTRKSRCWKLILLVNYLYALQTAHFLTVHNPYTKDGDILIGGLFPVHDYDDSTAACGQVLEISALRMIEAMVFAVEKINADVSILPNVTLGFEIFDTCLDPMTTLASSLELVPAQRTFVCFGDESRKEDTFFNTPPFCKRFMTATVGAERSTCSIQAASLLGLYHLPQISFLSTNDDFSNKNKYPYFARTVSPDKYQVRAITDLLLYFNWTFVSAVYSGDVYGTGGISSFHGVAEEKGICITTFLELSETDSTSDYDNIITGLLRYPLARVVVVFAHSDEVELLLEASMRAGTIGQFLWVATDGWGSRVLKTIKGREEAALGAILFKPSTASVPDFDRYYASIIPSESENPWIYEFMEEHTSCSKYPNLTGKISCDETDLFTETHTEDHASLVINAVLAIAMATHVVQEQYCSREKPLCDAINPPPGDVLMTYLLQLNFSGAGGRVYFDENGDPSGDFEILNIQMNEKGEYSVVTIGKWTQEIKGPSKLDLWGEIYWYNGTSQFSYDPGTENGTVPNSSCSQPCKEDEVILRSSDWQCCWWCQQCQPMEIMVHNDTECQACPQFTWPHQDLHHCVDISPDYLTWSNPWAITFTTMASIGLIAALATVAMYIKHNSNPLIKASSRELCYVILFGTMFLYAAVYYHIAKPSDVTCYFCRWTGIGLTMIYAPLATKTNRIYRIFASGKKTNKRPRLISSKSQVVIALVLISVEVIITAIFLLLYPPKVVVVMPDSTKPYVDMLCLPAPEFRITSFSYNILLVFASAFQAFKTRKLPNNYNESRFICFSVCTALLIAIAVLPAYVISPASKYLVLYSIMGLILNVTVVLFCIFFPKIYAIYFLNETDLNVQFNSPHPTDTNFAVNTVSSQSTNSSRHQPSAETGVDKQRVVLPFIHRLFAGWPKSKVDDVKQDTTAEVVHPTKEESHLEYITKRTSISLSYCNSTIDRKIESDI